MEGVLWSKSCELKSWDGSFVFLKHSKVNENEVEDFTFKTSLSSWKNPGISRKKFYSCGSRLTRTWTLVCRPTCWAHNSFTSDSRLGRSCKSSINVPSSSSNFSSSKSEFCFSGRQSKTSAAPCSLYSPCTQGCWKRAWTRPRALSHQTRLPAYRRSIKWNRTSTKSMKGLLASRRCPRWVLQPQDWGTTFRTTVSCAVVGTSIPQL